jgi:circadian clock protein KaiC
MNYESPELLGVSQMSETLKASPIVDNIILLNYVEFSNRLRRAITVPKARGTAPSRLTREYRIGPGGLLLEAQDDGTEADVVPQLPFSAYYGILARAPAHHSPIIEEQVASSAQNGGRVAPREETEKGAPATRTKAKGAARKSSLRK